MSRKRKKAKVTLPVVGRSGNVDQRAVLVDDPYEPGKKAPAMKNIKNHPLDEEHGNGNINDDQLAAGNRFLRLYEQSEIGGAKAIDYSQLKVDTSYVHKGLAIGVMEAAQELKEVRGYLGRRSYELLVSVVGNRLRMEMLAKEFSADPWACRRQLIYLRRALAVSLDELVDHFGIVAKGRGRGIRAEPVDIAQLTCQDS